MMFVSREENAMLTPIGRPERRSAARDDHAVGDCAGFSEAQRSAGFDEVWLEGQPLPELRHAEIFDPERHGDDRRLLTLGLQCLAAGEPHGVVEQRGDESAVHQAP